MYLDYKVAERKSLIQQVLACVEKVSQRRISVLDTTVGLFPKLDVAGSNPVSRSIESITYGRMTSENAITNEV